MEEVEFTLAGPDRDATLGCGGGGGSVEKESCAEVLNKADCSSFGSLVCDGALAVAGNYTDALAAIVQN